MVIVIEIEGILYSYIYSWSQIKVPIYCLS